MSAIRLSTVRMEYELARRGWDHVDLARAAGVSPATMSGAMRGRRIRRRTLVRLAAALERQPVLPEVERLLEAQPV